MSIYNKYIVRDAAVPGDSLSTYIESSHIIISWTSLTFSITILLVDDDDYSSIVVIRTEGRARSANYTRLYTYSVNTGTAELRIMYLL